MAASLTDGSGRVVCKAQGKLSDAESGNQSSWVLASSESRAYFWHMHCLDLPISRFRTYTLTVRVAEVDASSPNYSVVAVLRGGGIELP
jgi:hypothetical protein